MMIAMPTPAETPIPIFAAVVRLSVPPPVWEGMAVPLLLSWSLRDGEVDCGGVDVEDVDEVELLIVVIDDEEDLEDDVVGGDVVDDVVGGGGGGVVVVALGGGGAARNWKAKEMELPVPSWTMRA